MAIEYLGVRDLAALLGKVPTELRRELRPKLRESADHIVRDMKVRSSYSSRIPDAIRTDVLFSSRGGVRIRVNAAKAPHARPLEGLTTRGSTFRHPVFGNRDTWVSQPTRPFFFPAAKAGRGQLRDNVSEAIKAAMKGFR